MARGGGTFTTQNKVLPGAYINFVSKARAMGTLGERGVVALPFSLNWGKESKVISLTLEEFQTNSLNILGYAYTSDELYFLREVFTGASEVKLYRVSGGTKATATIEALTVTAKYVGTRGNDIKIVVENDIDTPNTYNVYTYILNEGSYELVDEQNVSTIDDLKNNDFVDFSGTGALSITASKNLENGTDTAPTGTSYQNFLNAVESVEYNTIISNTNDDTTKNLLVSFIKRMRDDVGYKATLVIHNYPKADYEGVISVKNTVEENGFIGANDLVYWVGGKTSGANVNESLTNTLYDGELTIVAEYTNTELTTCIENGEFVLYNDRTSYRVLKDINTFISFATNKNSDFRNNQVIRVLDEVANSTASIFNSYYLGKEQNDETGRTNFKVELINMVEQLQGIRAITNFSSDKITVAKGTEKGDVEVNISIEPVGAMEIIYMTCVVE